MADVGITGISNIYAYYMCGCHYVRVGMKAERLHASDVATTPVKQQRDDDDDVLHASGGGRGSHARGKGEDGTGIKGVAVDLSGVSCGTHEWTKK